MKRLFGSKKILLFLLVVLLAAAAGGYFFFLKEDSPGTTETPVPQEIQTDDLFTYLSAEPNFSTFSGILGRTNFADKLKADEEGVEPSFIIFAPENKLFETEEMKPFTALTNGLQDEIAGYHVAILQQDEDGMKPSLALTDGQILKTAGGRELNVKLVNGAPVIIDVKGRETKVVGNFAVDPKGNRIYFTDSVLLLQ